MKKISYIVSATSYMISTIVLFALITTAVMPASAQTENSIDRAVEYILSCQNADGGFGNGVGKNSNQVPTTEAVNGLACTGDLDRATKGDPLAYLATNPPSGSNLAGNLGRYIMAVVAAGGNPYDLGGVNYVELLKTEARKGNNSNLFSQALVPLGLAAAGEPNCVEAQQGIAFLMEKQGANGNWFGVDTTSLVILALIASGEDPSSESVQRAVSWLESVQNEDGGFPADGGSTQPSNSNSENLAIMAIYAIGDDPSTWVKNGQTPIDHLISLQQENGQINWTSSNAGYMPMQSTAWGVIALSKQWLPTAIYGDTTTAPVADFSANVTRGVAPLAVEFTDVSTNTPTSWAWDFDNDGSVDSTEQNPSYTYSTAGTYTVNLTATNSAGSDSEIKTGYITVGLQVLYDETVNLTSGQTFDFTAKDGTVYTDLPIETDLGALQSTGLDFVANDEWYDLYGSFFLESIEGVENAADWSYSWAIYINDVYASVGLSQNTLEDGDNVKFYYLPYDPVSYEALIDQALYLVDIDVDITSAPVANFTANRTSGVAPLAVEFTDLSTNSPTSWAWDFENDGTVDSTEQNPIYTYSTAGTYTVNLTVSNAGGSDEEIKTDYIVVSGPVLAPVANFTADKTRGVSPLAVEFTDASINTPTSWAWDFDNDGSVDSTEQNPSYTYSTAGTYTVNLTATNSAGSDSEIKTGYITVGLQVLYDETVNLTSGQTFDFTAKDGTVYTDLPIETDLGALQSTGLDFVANDEWYDLYGSFFLESIEGVENAADWSYSWAIYINDVYASVGLSQNTLEDGDNVKFYYLPYDPVSYEALIDQALYLVDIDVDITSAPVANFTANVTSGVDPLTVQFTDLSTNSPTSWAWDFENDGTVDSTEQNPIYTYSSAGTYTVKLVVSNSGGSDDEIKTDYITVGLQVLYDETVNLTSGQTFDFTAKDGTVYTDLPIETDLGALQSTGLDFVANDEWYDLYGSFFLESIEGVENAADWSYSWATYINDVYASVGLSQNTLEDGDNVKFYYLPYEPGTNAPLIEQALYLVDIDVDITSAPVANFTANVTRGVDPLTVQFTDLSTNSPTSWAWDFENDGSVDSTEQNPIYTYSSAGTYTVKLVVSNSGGSDDEIKTDYITVGLQVLYDETVNLTSGQTFDFTAKDGTVYTDLPIETDLGALQSTGLDFVANDEWYDLYGSFFLESIEGVENAADWSYSWAIYINDVYASVGLSQNTLEDGDNVKFYYLPYDPVSYEALIDQALYLVDIDVDITSAPVANFTANVTSGVAPLTVQFTDLSTNSPTSWAWDFNNDSIVDSTQQNPSYTYSTAGTYTVNLTVGNAGGSDEEIKTDYITVSTPVSAPVANFSATPTSGGAPLTVQFTDLSTNSPTSWAWDFENDGTVDSTEQNPSYTYSTAGTYTVKLTASNAGGSDDEIKSAYVTAINLKIYSTAYENTNLGAPDPAIAASSSAFVAWASTVVDYSPANQTNNFKDPSNALGPVTGSNTHIVSLGDLTQEQINAGELPGSLTLGFDVIITNGAGPDFAAFENGFGSQTSIFAELGYVEVSTDGVTFARFPSVSLTPGRVGGYGTIDPTGVYNLVGKHAFKYGTPFDLSDLADDPAVVSGAVDLNNINYVRIVDIPGSGDFKDSEGRPIYDAWVTFGSGGVDFDALGVINAVPKVAKIEVSKTANVTEACLGDIIGYSILVNNTGNVALNNVTAYDNLTDHQESIGSLAPGQSFSFNQSYQVTELDLCKPLVNNITVNGTSTTGVEVESSSLKTVEMVSNPAISVSKTANVTQAEVGDVVGYTILVNNTGDVSLNNVKAYDNLTGQTENIGTLAAGTSYSFSLTRQVAAEDAGKVVVNNVTANGTSPCGDLVEGYGTVSVTVEKEVVSNPAIAVNKRANVTEAGIGDVVSYKIWVNNTGDVVLNSVTAYDNLTDHQESIGSLAPGQSFSFEQTYKVAENDLCKPLVNNVTASGTTTSSATVESFDIETVEMVSNPAISVSKTANVTEAKVGDFVGYKIWVNNTGDVSLTSVTAHDDLTGQTKNIGTLAAGESYSFSLTRQVPSSDAGKVIVNKVTVTGMSPCGALAEGYGTASVAVERVSPATPAISVNKMANVTEAGLGDVIGYKIWVNNTGGVALNSVMVSDSLTGYRKDIGSLAPGQTFSFEQTYKVKEKDLCKPLVNKASATGRATTGVRVESSSTKTVDMISHPVITVTKVASMTSASVGDVVRYTVWVNNTGDVSLKNVRAYDNLTGQTKNIGTLAAGESYSFSLSRQVPSSDSGKVVVNKVTAKGMTPCSSQIEGYGTASVTIGQVSPPAIAVTKMANVTEAGLGDVIGYKIWVNNTGGVALNSVMVSDSLTGYRKNIGSLAPGQTFSFEQTYKVKEKDLCKPLVNKASAAGRATTGVRVESSSTKTVDMISHPAITVTKVASTTSASVGDVVRYTIWVNNTGDVSLKNVRAYDNLTGQTKNIGTLAAGESYSFSLTRQVPSSDSGKVVVNKVTAKGMTPCNSQIEGYGTASVTIGQVSRSAMAANKTANVTEAGLGDVVGNMTGMNNALNNSVNNTGASGTINSAILTNSSENTSTISAPAVPEVPENPVDAKTTKDNETSTLPGVLPENNGTTRLDFGNGIQVYVVQEKDHLLSSYATIIPNDGLANESSQGSIEQSSSPASDKVNATENSTTLSAGNESAMLKNEADTLLAQTNSTSESLANQSTPTSTISAANITTSLPAVQPPAISPTMNRTMNSSINTSNWHNLHNKDPVIHWARSEK